MACAIRAHVLTFMLNGVLKPGRRYRRAPSLVQSVCGHACQQTPTDPASASTIPEHAKRCLASVMRSKRMGNGIQRSWFGSVGTRTSVQLLQQTHLALWVRLKMGCASRTALAKCAMSLGAACGMLGLITLGKPHHIQLHLHHPVVWTQHYHFGALPAVRPNLSSVRILQGAKNASYVCMLGI
jgi:hypothetical protein